MVGYVRVCTAIKLILVATSLSSGEDCGFVSVIVLLRSLIVF